MDNSNLQCVPISYLEKTFDEVARLRAEIIKLKLELASTKSLLDLEMKFDEIESKVYSGLNTVFRRK